MASGGQTLGIAGFVACKTFEGNTSVKRERGSAPGRLMSLITSLICIFQTKSAVSHLCLIDECFIVQCC